MTLTAKKDRLEVIAKVELMIAQTEGSDIAPVGDSKETARLITSGAVVRLRMPEQGGAFAVETTGKTPGGGVTRGVIRGRSKPSRRRFQQSMGRADLTAVKGVLFLTLTWASGDVPSHSKQQRFLDNFLKWIARRFPGVPVAWAKERGKQKGRWHFHLVVFTAGWFPPAVYQAAWNRIAGNYAGNVDLTFKKDANAVRYLAKYISKDVGVWQDKPQETGVDKAEPAGACDTSPVDLDTAHNSPQEVKETHTGRTWGWRFYKNLALHPVIVKAVSVKVAHQVRRVLAKMQKAEVRGRMERWKAYADSLEWGRGVSSWPESVPDWIKAQSRKERTNPIAYCYNKYTESMREYHRFVRFGSHLARGSYNQRGWSCFTVGNGTLLTEGISTYFEGME